MQRRVGYKCTWVILVLPDFGVPSRTACGLFYVCAAFSCFVILRAILLFIRFAFLAYSFKLPVYRNLVFDLDFDESLLNEILITLVALCQLLPWSPSNVIIALFVACRSCFGRFGRCVSLWGVAAPSLDTFGF